MATFFSNQTIWYWGSTAFPVNGTLTGDVTRSGDTVTLSNMSLALSWPPQASGAWPVSFSLNGTKVYDASLSAWTGSIGLSNISFAVGTTATSANVSWSSSDNYSGSFTVTFPSGATGPSGGSCSFISSTWNSITIKGKVTNWGTGYSNPSRHFGVGGSTITSTSGGRREENVDGSSTTDATVTINNSDSALDGGINIRGCLAYRAYMWYGTSVGSSAVPEGGSWTTRYTPPAPPTASVTDGGYTFTQRKVTLTLTGDSSNNNSANVTFYYRYKKSTDSSYGSWTSMGTGSVTGTKTVTLNLAGSTAYNFQFLQQYQGQNSETRTVNYTTPAVPDQGILYGSVNGQAKRIRKLYGSVNGQAKEIVKLYGSVNGVAKRIY